MSETSVPGALIDVYKGRVRILRREESFKLEGRCSGKAS